MIATPKARASLSWGVMCLLAGAALGGCEPLHTEATDDARITQEVRKAVAGVEATRGHFEQLKIATDDGVVKLLGPVQSGEQKALIGALAQSVPGVRRIDNQLEIVPTR